jgi:RND family efflux transporter MFP subunit
MKESSSDNRRAAASTQVRGGRGKMLAFWVMPFLVLAALAIYSFVQKRNASRVLAEQTDRDAVPFVEVIHPTPLNVDATLVLPGSLEPYVNAPIYSRTDGYLKKWYRDIGSRVKQGELLAEIDTPEVDRQLQQTKADVDTAQANLNLATITAARYQDLIKTDSVSKQEVDNAVGDLNAKKAILQSAEANVKRLEELESFKRVYAPFSGVITRRNVDTGMLINSGNGGAAKELFDLAQIDPLRVFVAVPQTASQSIHAGLRACLELAEFSGKKFCGQVVRTADSIDPGTRTLRTEVDIPNPAGQLLPGAYAEVHFDLTVSGNRLSLPVNALLFRPEGTLAAVVTADNHIELRHIIIGRDFGNSVEVLLGLDAKDMVVVNPSDSLESGAQVRVKPPSPKP